MKRRNLILGGPLLLTAPLFLSGCTGTLKGHATLADARKAVDGITARWRVLGAWSMPEVLNHLAQSIEYSMSGFPKPNSRWFRHSVGPAAFTYFDARGEMSHDLAEPIPGAPPINGTLSVAKARLISALADFEGYRQPLMAHFAYGNLSHEKYTRAHLMHLANHWTEFKPA